MKKTMLAGTLLLLLTPLLAQASCESVRDDIARKIIANGVPESGFELDIVPNDQVSQHGGQVVGHCEQDTQKSSISVCRMIPMFYPNLRHRPANLANRLRKTRR